MKYIKIKTIPKILFAHSFGAEKYEKALPVRNNRIEISYISKGEMTVNAVSKSKYTISCNIFDKETRISTPRFHEHHTVCFTLEYDIVENNDKDTLALPETLTFSEYQHCHELIDKIIQLYTLYPEDELTLSGMFLELISECSKQSTHPGRMRASVYADKAKEYVYSHLYESITQRDVAEKLGITPEYLCAVFKKANGISFMKFVNFTKLSKIKDIMKRENLKLYEAAEIFGYSDPNYVSRLRKKYRL